MQADTMGMNPQQRLPRGRQRQAVDFQQAHGTLHLDQ